MSQAKIDLLIEQLEKARAETLAKAEATPEAARMKQLAPGKGTPLWFIGHLGNTVNTIVLCWILGLPSVLKREEAIKFSPDIAGGTPPTDDPADYPDWDTVVANYDKILGMAIDGLKAQLQDDDLEKPIERAPEMFQAFFGNIGGALKQMVNHDAYHRGQVGLLISLDK